MDEEEEQGGKREGRFLSSAKELPALSKLLLACRPPSSLLVLCGGLFLRVAGAPQSCWGKAGSGLCSAVQRGCPRREGPAGSRGLLPLGSRLPLIRRHVGELAAVSEFSRETGNWTLCSRSRLKGSGECAKGSKQNVPTRLLWPVWPPAGKPVF